MVCTCRNEIMDMVQQAKSAGGDMKDIISILNTDTETNNQKNVTWKMFQQLGLTNSVGYEAIFSACDWIDQVEQLCTIKKRQIRLLKRLNYTNAEKAEVEKATCSIMQGACTSTGAIDPNNNPLSAP